MYWASDGTQIIWDNHSNGPQLRVSVPFNLKIEEQNSSTKIDIPNDYKALISQFALSFSILHQNSTKKILGSTIRSSCKNYATAIQSFRPWSEAHYEIIFQLFDACILSPNDENIKDQVIQILRPLINDYLNTIQDTHINHLLLDLVYKNTDNFCSRYTSADGSSSVAEHLLHFYKTTDLKEWKDILYSTDSATEFDKLVIDTILSPLINESDLFLPSFIISLFFKYPQANVSTISELAQKYQVFENNFEFLIFSLLSGKLPEVMEISFKITNSSLIAAHLIDLIYTISTMNRESPILYSGISLQLHRDLAIFRYIEFLACDSHTSNIYIHDYISTIKGYIYTKPEATYEIIVPVDLINRTEKAVSENDVVELSKILNREFLKADYLTRKKIATICGPEYPELSSEATVALLEASIDDEIKRNALTKLFFQSYSLESSIPNFISPYN